MTDSVERDIYLPVAAQPSIETFAAFAERAERQGYERVWCPETWGRDAVTILSAIAERTDRIGVGSSILNVYSRSPALLGQTAATLQELSGGRFRMGLGPSGPILVEGWHGTEFESPLRFTRETIEIVKTVVAGEPLEYDGSIHQLSGFRLRFDPPDPAPPIDAGGMSPKSVELAGRFADGWHALMLTPDGLRDRLDDFDRGCDLGDRDRSDQRVTLSLPCMALSDGERARDLVRNHIAFYVGGMGTFYREALERQGFEETAQTVAAEWANRNKAAAEDAIGEELLDSLSAAGTPEHVREQFERFADIEGIDAVNVSFPRAAEPDEIETTIDLLAP
jgi:coenzyme F420-dependent oxidoreductase